MSRRRWTVGRLWLRRHRTTERYAETLPLGDRYDFWMDVADANLRTIPWSLGIMVLGLLLVFAARFV